MGRCDGWVRHRAIPHCGGDGVSGEGDVYVREVHVLDSFRDKVVKFVLGGLYVKGVSRNITRVWNIYHD